MHAQRRQGNQRGEHGHCRSGLAGRLARVVMHDQFLCVLRLLFALTSVISTRSLHARDGITQDSENAAILQPPTTSIAELAPATTAYKLGSSAK
jgi:hypothetical protein